MQLKTEDTTPMSTTDDAAYDLEAVDPRWLPSNHLDENPPLALRALNER
jgi:hypothetical protein